MYFGIRIIEFEALAIIELEFAVPLDERPDLLRLPFLNAEDVVLKMGSEVKGGGIIGTIIIDDEDAVFIPELAEVDAVFIVVDAQHIGVEPHFASAERGVTFLLEGNGLDFKLGEYVSSCCTRFDRQLGEIFADLEFLEMQLRFECHFDNLRFSVGIRCEINDFRAGRTLGEVVLFVFRNAGDVKALHEINAFLSVTVHDVVHGAIIIALEDGDMEEIGAHKEFVRHFHDFIFTVLVENDDVIYVGTIEEVFVLFESCSDETFLAIDIEFFVVFNDRLYVNRSEVANLCASRVCFAVLRWCIP